MIAATSLDDLRAKARAPGAAVTMLQARALVEQARGFGVHHGDLRIAVVHTYTSDTLDPWLELAAALEGFGVAVHHAPYGLALGEARAGSALVQFAPDLTVLLLQAGDLDPALASPVVALGADTRAALAEAAAGRLIDLAATFRAQPVGRLVLSVLPSTAPPDLGLHDAVGEGGERGWWAHVKAIVGEAVRDRLPSTSILDLDEVLAEIGREAFFDRRTWYAARAPFTARAAAEVARRVVALGVVAKRPRVKVIALDADNTLWGGVIGEDGMEGIQLGPDYPGRCYVDFQRRILGLQQRGFILALCSKNNPADVEQVLRDHPHMLLREGHFAATRVNWQPKIDNLNELAEELSLGIDSFLLVDDSAYEVEAVRRELPQVDVIQTPSRAVDVPSCLDKVARLEILSLTAEDRRKTAIYAAERERRELKRTMAGDGIDLAAYLRSLDMRMRIGIDDAAQVKRLAQLTQKTNQFNLTTRRYDEAAIAAMIADPAWMVAHFSLADTFGDSGLVGLALVHLESVQTGAERVPNGVKPASSEAQPGHGEGESEQVSTRARLDTFLMSCRVIGREAESAFLEAVLGRLAVAGVGLVEGEYLPTAKNVLAKDFFVLQGFSVDGNGTWHRDLHAAPPRALSLFPIAIEIA